MLTTLKLNQITLSYTQKELIELGFAVASGISGYEDILKWIQNVASGRKKTLSPAPFPRPAAPVL